MANRPRVLVADDHSGMVRAVCHLLAPNCDVVGTVADGNALLVAAERLQPDIIVLDVNLPIVNGLEATRQITQTNPGIKLIVFTAMSDPEIREQSLAVGASAFVCKLDFGDELLAAIARLCPADRESV